MARTRAYLLAIATALALLGWPVSAAADTFTGTLNVLWGDPDTLGHGGAKAYVLATPDGRYWDVSMPASTNFLSMLPLDRRPVVVTGTLTGHTIAADSLVLASGAPPAPSLAVTGSKKTLFLLLKFASDVAAGRPDPRPASFYLDLTNPDLPPAGSNVLMTLNGFFKKTSNNLFSWEAEVGGVGGVGGTAWITLPQNQSAYVGCSTPTFNVCIDFDRLNRDAVAAATAQGIDLTPYHTINFVFSNELDEYPWSGSITVGAMTYGATWFSPRYQEAMNYSHHLGHSLGLTHSGWVHHSYDNRWDLMGGAGPSTYLPCGSYVRFVNPEVLRCFDVYNGYMMPQRALLGWIPAGNQVTVPANGKATATIEAGAFPLSGAAKMITLCLQGYSCSGTGPSTRYVTLEARVKDTSAGPSLDSAFIQGVLMNDVWFGRPDPRKSCYPSDPGGWMQPIDPTPYDLTYEGTCIVPRGPGLGNAVLTPGESLKLWPFDIKVTVDTRAGNTFTVSVHRFTPAGDFDTDWRHDFTVYTANGEWAVNKSAGGYGSSPTTIVANVGGPGFVPVIGDFDGDGRQDPAFYNPTTGQWRARESSTNFTTTFSANWGGVGYLAVPGDYDGDGKTDPAVYVQKTGQWYILKSNAGYTTSMNVSLGGAGYTAVSGRDFDGDLESDVAVYSASTGYWHILESSSGYTTARNVRWWCVGCVLVPGDYDGDEKDDLGLYRRATGDWLVLKSTTGFTSSLSARLGGPGYDPVPGNYDYDNKYDLAVVERSTGKWSISSSQTSYGSSYTYNSWSAAADTVVSSAIVPVGANDTTRASDFENDVVSDLTVYNASTGFWHTLTSASGFTAAINRSWGGPGYTPVAGDFDGDGRTDYGAYVAATGAWTVLLSGEGYTTALNRTLGASSRPVAGDYDGDRKTDIAVYDESTGSWNVLKSSTNFTNTSSLNWGGAGYTPAPGDYDGDGQADLGVYQQSTGIWYVLLSSANYTTSMSRTAGGPGYVEVAGDYDGDGRTDFVVYNTTSGLWHGLKSGNAYLTELNVTWGGTGSTPVKGDYDGDGRIDLAVYTSSGDWLIRLSGSGYTTTVTRNWGGAGYAPVPMYQ